MAIPTKKIYGRNGKLIFDPSNPKDVENYKKRQPLMEALKLVQGLADPRGGAGLTGMTRVISKAFGAKAAKALFKQNKAKQIADLVTKPMTRGKKAKSIVKEVVEKKPTIPTTIPTSGSNVSDKIKSLTNAEIKAFENVKNVRELAEKQAKNAPTTTIPTTVPKKRVSEIVREAMDARKLGTKGPTREEMKLYYQKTAIAKKTAKDIVTNKKLKTELEKIRETNKPFYEKSIKEAIDASNKKIAIGTGIIGGLAAAGGTYYGMQLSNKDKKQTTTPQKTGPVDLKRIDKSKLKDSNIEGVKTIRGSDGKDYGIQWNNTTKSWDYYRGDKTKKTTETPKPDLKREDVGGGYTPIKDNKGSGTGSGGKTTTGGGTGTKPRSATGQAFDKAFAEARKQAGGAGGIFEWNGKKYGTALEGETVPKDRVEVGKTTAPLMGDEYYKKDPRLATLRQQDDDRQLLARAEAQKKEMKEFKPTESLDVLPMPTKPLSSLMFKTSTLNPKTNSRVEPVSYDTIDIVDTKSKKLRKKSYGGNLAMLKYMKK